MVFESHGLTDGLMEQNDVPGADVDDNESDSEEDMDDDSSPIEKVTGNFLTHFCRSTKR